MTHMDRNLKESQLLNLKFKGSFYPAVCNCTFLESDIPAQKIYI